MASSNKKVKTEVEPVEVDGGEMYHLGDQIMMFVDQYNNKIFSRITKYEHNRDHTYIYPTKDVMTSSFISLSVLCLFGETLLMSKLQHDVLCYVRTSSFLSLYDNVN